jgi:hypothetical protein
MVSIDRPNPRTARRHGRAGRTAAADLVCLLVFSLGALLTDGLALMMQAETPLAPLSFALIAGAAPMAATVALRSVGHADERLPETYWNDDGRT